MRTLVAAPAAERKHYSFARWAAATSPYERVIATEELQYAEVVQRDYGVPVVLYDPPESRRVGRHAMHGERFNAAWQAIVDSAQGFTHILSLESDIIPPPEPDIVTLMQDNYGPEDFLCHLHPWRKEYHRPGVLVCEMGCTFGTVDAFRIALAKCWEVGRTLYGQVLQPPFTHRDIHIVELDHLDDKEYDGP